MEYSKEDLMEAKKQILGVGENMGTEESKKIWEENAQFWDNAMGDESNEFHREVVRPKVTELLSPNPADYILDIACGNGNYSSYLAQRGASVVAFDYSKKMIELAKRRQSQYAKQIEFCVADATDRKSILELKRNRAFTKAVSNMAIMDITDIEPLLMAVYELLQESGIFVFATQHPCFVTLTEKYMTPHSYYDIAIEGQPKEQIYYHRSIKMLREAARSDQPEDKLLLWLSRPSGTFCFRERDVLLKDTQAYNTWKFCGEQTHDRILAYAVELTGAANGTVQGNLYELDYQQHFQHIREAALPVGANRLIYESGMREIGPKEHFDSRPDKYFGELVRYEMQPRDPELLQAATRQEQRSLESAQPGDFKEHLAALHTGLIEAEAQRIVADMKRLAAPNSPDKNHFMVEVSPYFTKLASSRDTDQLLAMLPYKSLHLSSVKDRFGICALIDKNENRDKGIHKPRTSVRKQLSETKQAASPKKAAARSKQHEIEV